MRNGHAGVRLMNDYGCRWPIWWIEAQQAEPEALDLSEGLAADVRAWAKHFAEHFDYLTLWDSDEARRTHARLADSLLERLRAEIGDELEVHSDLWELDAPRT